MRNAFILVALFAVGQLVFGGEPPAIGLEEAQAKQLLLFAAKPSYPYDAYRMRVSGYGIFDLRFDYETGHLQEIHVVKSTGNNFLDGHAIGALKLWKAKPRSIRILRVPIDFAYKPRLRD